MHAVVEDLTGRSEEFTRIWDSGAVASQEYASKVVEHPQLGLLELDCDVLTAEQGDLRVVVYTAEATPELPPLQAIRDEATRTIWTGLAAAADRHQSSDPSSQTSGRLRPRSTPMV